MKQILEHDLLLAPTRLIFPVRLQTHDVLSTAMGSLCVTSYCVWRGQSPAVALGITVLATISGLVRRQACVATQADPISSTC